MCSGSSVGKNNYSAGITVLTWGGRGRGCVCSLLTFPLSTLAINFRQKNLIHQSQPVLNFSRTASCQLCPNFVCTFYVSELKATKEHGGRISDSVTSQEEQLQVHQNPEGSKAGCHLTNIFLLY